MSKTTAKTAKTTRKPGQSPCKPALAAPAKPRAPRDNDPAKLTYVPTTQVVKTGADDRGNPTFKIVQTDKPVAWMRASQLARALGVSTRTIYCWMATGVIPSDKWERRGPRIIYIAASEFERLRDTGEK
ncbi:MAG: helix-turn-helix domain-containing protein [Opitutaceae bacterium]|jgi:hypothetical protein|nr:helix-turn-helix domain-containing protein [Opitutaceae bacterium]